MQEALRTVHESATEDALNVYNSEAVGAGAARQKYEKLLLANFKRNFEVMFGLKYCCYFSAIFLGFSKA